MNRLASLHEHLTAAARGLGFDRDERRPDLERGDLEKKIADGRRLVLRIARATDGDAIDVLRLEASVALPDAPALTIRRRTVARAFWDALAAKRSILSLDPLLDAIAVLESPEQIRARAAVKAGLGAVARELLLEHPEGSLAVRGKAVVISIEAREGCLERLIDFATRAATAIEASRIRPVEKPAAVRCGFCHEDLGEDDERVVRCDHCAAPVHASCWQAHEGCPAFACSGVAR